MGSLLRQLELDGYLSLSKFVRFLRENAPQASISYPTALKLVQEGKLKAVKLGSQYRITRSEAERWIAEGNWEGGLPSPNHPYGRNIY